jgi:hypothetical protein
MFILELGCELPLKTGGILKQPTTMDRNGKIGNRCSNCDITGGKDDAL